MAECPICFKQVPQGSIEVHVMSCLDQQDRAAREKQEQEDAMLAVSLAQQAFGGHAALDGDDDDDNADPLPEKIEDAEPLAELDCAQPGAMEKLVIQAKANQGLYYPRIARNALAANRSLEEAAAISDPPLQYCFLHTAAQVRSVSQLAPELVAASVRFAPTSNAEENCAALVHLLDHLPPNFRSVHFFSIKEAVASRPEFIAAVGRCKVRHVLLDVDSWDCWDPLITAIGNNTWIESLVTLDSRAGLDAKQTLRSKRVLMWFDRDFDGGTFSSYPGFGKDGPLQVFFAKDDVPPEQMQCVPEGGIRVPMGFVGEGIRNLADLNKFPAFGLWSILHIHCFEDEEPSPALIAQYLENSNFRVSAISPEMHHDFSVMLAAMMRDTANDIPGLRALRKQCEHYSRVVSMVDRYFEFQPTAKVVRKYPLRVRIALFQWMLVSKRQQGINRDLALLICSFIVTRDGW